MKTTKPANSVQIEFHFDESYREKVIKRNPLDVWIELSMAVNDTDIYGGDNRNVTGIAASAMLQFLDSADPVLSGERHIIEFESGPSWLALDPRDEESISIIKCLTLRGAKNPLERRDLYTPHPATKQAWITEVLGTAREFHEIVLELDPAIESRKDIELIREGIASIEQKLE